MNQATSIKTGRKMVQRLTVAAIVRDLLNHHKHLVDRGYNKDRYSVFEDPKVEAEYFKQGENIFENLVKTLPIVAQEVRQFKKIKEAKEYLSSKIETYCKDHSFKIDRGTSQLRGRGIEIAEKYGEYSAYLIAIDFANG